MLSPFIAKIGALFKNSIRKLHNDDLTSLGENTENSTTLTNLKKNQLGSRV